MKYYTIKRLPAGFDYSLSFTFKDFVQLFYTSYCEKRCSSSVFSSKYCSKSCHHYERFSLVKFDTGILNTNTSYISDETQPVFAQYKWSLTTKPTVVLFSCNTTKFWYSYVHFLVRWIIICTTKSFDSINLLPDLLPLKETTRMPPLLRLGSWTAQQTVQVSFHARLAR